MMKLTHLNLMNLKSQRLRPRNSAYPPQDLAWCKYLCKPPATEMTNFILRSEEMKFSPRMRVDESILSLVTSAPQYSLEISQSYSWKASAGHSHSEFSYRENIRRDRHYSNCSKQHLWPSWKPCLVSGSLIRSHYFFGRHQPLQAISGGENTQSSLGVKLWLIVLLFPNPTKYLEMNYGCHSFKYFEFNTETGIKFFE